MLAWALSRWLGIRPFDRLDLTPAAVIIGAAASAPLLLGLWWTLSTRVRSVRRLVELVQAQLGPVLASRSSLELALLATLAGAAEETLFRGVVQVWLARAMPEELALVVAGALFGAAHFVTPMYALLAAMAGIYLGAVFWAQGNLLVPLVAHALYDFVALTYLVHRHPTGPRSPD